ncbi:MAG: WG repeat-containing protein, partial [Flavobacteriales bacterium]|nr:WG repeat-containing protein [Flavobacteriales bacterium]
MRRSILRAALLVVHVVFSSLSFAGPLEKAFEALEVHNYFLAREIFLKQVKKHPAGAWYGLSVISGRDNNPFYRLDSAYAYIQRADVAYTAAPDKERQALKKVNVDHAALVAQRELLHDRAWELAKGQHTIAAYDKYIRTYETSARVADATLVRDHLAFQEARTANTAAAYRAFLDRYPNARQAYEARTRMQEAVYREATADGTIAAYLAFIREHEESPYVEQAEDEVFKASTPLRTIQQYKAFIDAHPKNHRVPDAWRSIYEISTRDLSVGSITAFLQAYPDYPFVEELVDDYKTASLRLLPFRHGDRWGFIDEDGNERIKAEYDWVEPFEGGQALVGRGDRVGTINRSGRAVVPIEYDEVLDPVEGTST